LGNIFPQLLSLWRCHGPKPPPNPEFTLKPKKKKIIQQSEGVPGTPCPPCPELVWRSCVGQHIGADRMVCFAYLQSSIWTSTCNIWLFCPKATSFLLLIQFLFSFHPTVRWFALINHSSPVKIYVVILYHVAIIIVQKPAMPWITNYEEVNHVKIVIFLAKRC